MKHGVVDGDSGGFRHCSVELIFPRLLHVNWTGAKLKAGCSVHLEEASHRAFLSVSRDLAAFRHSSLWRSRSKAVKRGGPGKKRD